jgi:hypothetical protein
MNQIKETITSEEVVDFLNDLLITDLFAISSLFSLRISCNKALAGHSTVQVGVLSKDHFIVGMLGILNGFFGIDEHGWGHISVDYEDGRISRFRLLTEEDTAKYTTKGREEGDR